MSYLFLFWCSFLNSCGCSTAKVEDSTVGDFFHPFNGTEHGSPPFLTTRDRAPVSVARNQRTSMLIIRKFKEFFYEVSHQNLRKVQLLNNKINRNSLSYNYPVTGNITFDK